MLARLIYRLGPVAAIALFLAPTLVFAGPITLKKPWSSIQEDKSGVASVFLTIENQGEDGDTLLSISTPMAEGAQLHNTKMKHGKMRMRRNTGLAVPPKSDVTLEHDGTHIMLTGLKSPLLAGTNFSLTLHFEKAGALEVQVTAKGTAD